MSSRRCVDARESRRDLAVDVFAANITRRSSGADELSTYLGGWRERARRSLAFINITRVMLTGWLPLGTDWRNAAERRQIATTIVRRRRLWRTRLDTVRPIRCASDWRPRLSGASRLERRVPLPDRERCGVSGSGLVSEQAILSIPSRLSDRLITLLKIARTFR